MPSRPWKGNAPGPEVQAAGLDASKQGRIEVIQIVSEDRVDQARCMYASCVSVAGKKGLDIPGHLVTYLDLHIHIDVKVLCLLVVKK